MAAISLTRIQKKCLFALSVSASRANPDWRCVSLRQEASQNWILTPEDRYN